MTIVRVPSINELLSISLQSAQGSMVTTPATGDVTTFLRCDLNPSIENILRSDVGLGRSHFGYTAPGKQTARWSADVYAQLANAATPVVAPLCEGLLVGAFGATAVSFNDTVQASPTPTSSQFAVSNASTLKVGDSLACNIGGSFGWQMRPVSGISSNTLTFSPPFGAAPTAGAIVKARIYRLSDAVNFFTIVDWLRDSNLAVSALSRVAVDAVVDTFTLDASQTIVQLSAGGPASFVVEQQTPAEGSWAGTFPTLPTLPTNIVTGYAPETPYLNGEFFLDTTLFTAYSVKMALSNGAKQLPVPFGSQFADGVQFGVRDVQIDVTADGNSANYGFFLDSEQKNPHALFFHTGQTVGQFIGVYSPKMVLGLNDYDKGDVTVRLNFQSSRAFATQADNEITLSIA